MVLTVQPETSDCREQGHADAFKCIMYGHWVDAIEVYEDHLKKYPKDQSAVTLAYFLSFYSGKREKVRDICSVG